VTDLPRLPVSDRTVGRTFTDPKTGKVWRPSTFGTVTMDSYGPVRPDGTPVDPASYDYRRAALDAMHLPKLWDRFVQNLRRAVGYDVQYFAVIEPQRRHPMATARELMSQGVECVSSTETLVEAARKMRDLDVGALPICGEDQRLKGMLTDRDIVVNCIAEGKDPNDVTAADLAQGKPVTIGADDSAEETLRTMAKYQVRRLPVIDGHQLVATVAQADVARALPNEVVGQVLEEVSEK